MKAARLKNLTLGLLMFAATASPAGEPSQAPDLVPVKMLDAPKHPPVELVRKGEAQGVVYVADPAPSAGLKLLVAELVEAVRLSTGAQLPLVTDPPAADRAAIIVGDCEEARKAGIDAAKLPIEGFEVKTAPNRVYLVGSTMPLPPNATHPDTYANQGTAWAVADFLERFVGVRWYWPTQFGGRTLMKSDELRIAPTHYADAPAFRKRSHWPPAYNGWKSRWFDKAQPQPPEMAKGVGTIDMKPLLACLRAGNSWPYLIKVHQPQWWPDDQWKSLNKQYPTMFALNADGTRSKGMLCYSSKETLEYLIRGCEESWDKGKLGAIPWVTEMCLSISPGDAPINCQCADCRKMIEPEAPWHGAAGSPASKLMGAFVKRACEEVQRRWPNKKVIYLPYWNYALCPEGIDFPDNLEVEMATSGFAGFRQPELRESIGKDLRAWSRKAGGKITTWEYSCWVTGWSHAAVQFPHILQDYYRTNREVLAGSFVNGAEIPEWSRCAPSLYVWMRVLWNPDINVEATLDEMCARLYGKGGKTARELLRLMCDRWEKAPWSEPLGVAGHFSPYIYLDTWPPEVVAQMGKLRRQAIEEMKDDPLALNRFSYWTWTFDEFLNEWKEFAAVFDVPRLKEIVVDGKDGDWGEAGLRVDTLVGGNGETRPPAGLEPSFRLGWDEKGLLVLVRVMAPDFREAEKDNELYNGDCIEMYLSLRVGSMDRVQAVVSPGMDPKHPNLRIWTNDMRRRKGLKKVELKVEAARTKLAGGYLLEARLPWAPLGIEPRVGSEPAFQLYVARKQADGKLSHAIWYPRSGAAFDPHCYHRIRLAE